MKKGIIITGLIIMAGVVGLVAYLLPRLDESGLRGLTSQPPAFKEQNFEINSEALIKDEIFSALDNKAWASPDFLHVGWAEARGGKECMVIDGVPGQDYDEIHTISPKGSGVFRRYPILHWAPQGGRYAYGAKAQGVWKMVIDGREEGPWDDLGHGEFSPDGSRYAYAATRAGKRYVVVDGKEYGPYEFSPVPKGSEVTVSTIFMVTPFFSPDSRQVAWIGARPGKMFAVLDGIEGAPVAGLIGTALFSPNSEVFAYKIAARETKNYTWVLQQGQQIQKIDGLSTVKFAPSGGGFAYTVRRGKVFSLVDHKGPVGQCASGDEFWWSEDGQEMAWVKMTPQGARVLMSGTREYPVRGKVSQLTFSRDRRQLLWVTQENKREKVFVDGGEIAQAKGITWAHFTGPQQLPWIALQENKTSILLYGGGRSRAYTKLGPLKRAAGPGRSACWAMVNHQVKEKKKVLWTPTYYLLVDGQEIATITGSPNTENKSSIPYDDHIQFTPDGQQVVCLAAYPMEGEVMLVDGRPLSKERDYNSQNFLGAPKDSALQALVGVMNIFLLFKDLTGGVTRELREAVPEVKDVGIVALVSLAAPLMGIGQNRSDWSAQFNDNYEQDPRFALAAPGLARFAIYAEKDKLIRIRLTQRALK